MLSKWTNFIKNCKLRGVVRLARWTAKHNLLLIKEITRVFQRWTSSAYKFLKISYTKGKRRCKKRKRWLRRHWLILITRNKSWSKCRKSTLEAIWGLRRSMPTFLSLLILLLITCLRDNPCHRAAGNHWWGSKLLIPKSWLKTPIWRQRSKNWSIFVEKSWLKLWTLQRVLERESQT